MNVSAPKSEAIAGDLYGLLRERLPICRAEGGQLCVAKLADNLKMSQEGVYRWLRADVISKRGLNRLLEIADRDENRDALLASGTPHLTDNDLRPFL